MLSALELQDPEVAEILHGEELRQRSHLELIASENFTSEAVLDCLGSVMTNKYSEGQPGARYYGGTEFVDLAENTCKKRALMAFNLDPNEWDLNVQCYSGSPANLEVYMALLKPNDRIMGLSLNSGGHITHGHYIKNKPLSASSTFYQSLPYDIDNKTGLVDMIKLRELALKFRPKLLIAGGSAYSRMWELEEYRSLANELEIPLMCDMAHVSGLVAVGLHENPFIHSDIVTTTTHKTLRGPRGAMIFYRKNSTFLPTDIKNRIDSAVFPGLQGGPHNNQILALCVQLKELTTPKFKNYCINVLQNAQVLSKYLISQGETIVTDGTDNHLFLWDLKKHGISGSKLEKICDAVNITLNRNTVPGDTSPLSPNGVRIGTPALTTRECNGDKWLQIGAFLLEALSITKSIQEKTGKKLTDFTAAISYEKIPELEDLKNRVAEFAMSFPFPTKVFKEKMLN